MTAAYHPTVAARGERVRPGGRAGGGRRLHLCPLHTLQIASAPYFETEAEVQVDGLAIGFDHPKPGLRTFGPVGGDDSREDGGTQATSGVGRVAAQGTDFSPGGLAWKIEAKPLAPHGDQASVEVAHAEVPPHAAGLGAKVTGVGDRDERHHFGGVAAIERLDGEGGRGEGGRGLGGQSFHG